MQFSFRMSNPKRANVTSWQHEKVNKSIAHTLTDIFPYVGRLKIAPHSSPREHRFKLDFLFNFYQPCVPRLAVAVIFRSNEAICVCCVGTNSMVTHINRRFAVEFIRHNAFRCEQFFAFVAFFCCLQFVVLSLTLVGVIFLVRPAPQSLLWVEHFFHVEFDRRG